MDKVRTLDVLLFEDLNLLDVAGPVQAFSAANQQVECYRLRYVSVDGAAVRASCGLRLGADRAIALDDGQDLLIPGGCGVDRMMHNKALIHTVRHWLTSGQDRRLISICSGALILANSGLLDGRKATTHWSREPEIRQQFPKVHWATHELYHIEAPIFTSAGVSSGIDLALEMIHRDQGSDVALSVARELVVYLKRSAGQNPFTDLLEAQFSDDPPLSRLIGALQQAPGKAWTLENMADTAGLTPRTLVRRFSASTGYSPVKYLERYRVKRASQALSSGVPVAQCIKLSGFSDFQQMQRAFKRQLGTTVGGYAEHFSKQ